MSLRERFYYWAVRIGKYVIIVTELIVVACFAIKVGIDTQLQVLKTHIDAEITTMKGIYPQELTIRHYQEKSSSQAFLMKNQYQVNDLLTHSLNLINSTSSKFNITSISIDSKTGLSAQITIDGNSEAENKIVQSLEDKFRADTLYTNVGENTLSSSAGKITFSLTANFNK